MDPATLLGAPAARWRALSAQTSEYPEPITFRAGAPLKVGERYACLEGWNNWWFCETPGQTGGWVPAQCDRPAPCMRGRTTPHAN